MIKVGEQTFDGQPGITLDRLMARMDRGHMIAVVRLNGRLISRPDFAGTLIPEGAELEPLPLVAGG
jgi:hypothetical protein